MPFVHIRIAGAELSPAIIESLQTGATELMAGIMRKNPELTAVFVEALEAGRWSIGGSNVPLAAHLEVKVTAGTNSAEEKAAFVRQAHDLLRRALAADLPLATYVVIDEVPAKAWGYGGLTQEARRAATT